MKQKHKMKLWKKILILIAVLLLAAGVGCGVYLGDYYHAESSAIEAITDPENGVRVSRSDNGQIVFTPENPPADLSAGLIFYPGGKVQYEAYAPLMEACAQRGILCVLVHMPGNLAVFDINAADGIREQYPDITKWYLAGHSLGGSMAASYLGSHAEEYDGLILLASYSTEDLSKSGLDVLSVYGSEDGVLKMDSYEKYRKNLPEDFTEIIILGGCHAYFGCYGPQDGDGTPEISNEEQIRLTADAIEEMVMP